MRGSFHPDNFPDVDKGAGEGLQSWRKVVLKKYLAAKREERWTKWGDSCTGAVHWSGFALCIPKKGVMAQFGQD